MASQADVRDAIKGVVLAGVYPNGFGAPSVTGNAILAISGWPNSEQLTKQIAAGGSIVSVYPEPGMSVCVSRYNDSSAPIVTQPPTVTLTPTIAGNVVTIAGAPAAGQVIGVSVGYTASKQTYSYRILAGDTTATIASDLAALIPGATVSGSAVTIPGAYPITVRVVADVLAIMRLTRMKDTFRVTTWAPNQVDRDTIASVVFATLATIPYITLPLGLTGRMLPQGSRPSDSGSGASTYRQDERFSVEYDVTTTATQPCALFIVSNINSFPSIAS